MARRKFRNVNGILLLDKPIGLTSNAALQKVKRLFKADKAGHTGSLDPLATGLLPLCFGRATKISAFLLDADKRYEVVAKFGERTTTGDAEGDVTETRPVPADLADRLAAESDAFRGVIAQIPPMYSALKHEGERLYSLARKGIEVEREAREVTIHELNMGAVSGDSVAFDVHCSKGTYVRTLIEDLGEAVGCGAHVSVLRRTGVGAFESGTMITLEQLETVAEQGVEALDALLLNIDSAIADWPKVELDADSCYYLRQGQAVIVPRAPTDGLVAVYGKLSPADVEPSFIGVGEIQDDGRVKPKRLFVTE